MPGLDGTGPIGQGARTGRGECKSIKGGNRLGQGNRFGMRNGFGQCRGLNCSLAQPQKDELTLLKNQSIVIENHLNTIKNRISELG